MGKRSQHDMEKERQSELAAIWGSDVRGDRRIPSWRKGQNASTPVPFDETAVGSGDADRDDVVSNISSLVGSNKDDKKHAAKKDAKKQGGAGDMKKKTRQGYRLHCFVEVGTNINDVREVFERYEPKVDIRTAQKGNLLNKVQYAVLTFPNKAVALHAVKTLDGTSQRDLLGVSSLKLSMMLTREQNKILRRRTKKERERAMKAQRLQQIENDEEFLRKLVAGLRKDKPTKK